MKKLLFIMLLSGCYAFSQNANNLETYNYGKNGMEYIVKYKSGKTFIVSTFNSRPTIIDEVAEDVYKYYKEKAPQDGERIIISANNATVIGTCYIKTKDQLTSIEFHYESVLWNNGLTEVYKNPETTIPTAAVATNDD